MSDRKRKYGGYLLTEFVIFLAVLGILLTCLALSLDGFRRFNHYQLVRQRCIAAAQAQLDSITVTGRQINEDDFKQLWPKLTIRIEKADGTGQWNGLELISIKAKGKSFNKNIEVQLTRYISTETRR